MKNALRLNKLKSERAEDERMNAKKIPVVFTPDENFIVQTSIAILSMLENKKNETQYYFYIVVSNQMGDENLAILERIKDIIAEFEYEVIRINSELLDQQKVTTRHLSTSAYYRLILAEVLNENKCMYHDGDILVLDDLSEMFDKNVQDVYVAGIKAIAKMQPTEQNMKQIEQWGWQSFEQYILSGDLVFNLEKIRKEGLVDEFRRQMQKGFPSEDQDVINYCCYGKIDFLPVKFCMMNRWFCPNVFDNMSRQVYGTEELEEALHKPVIVHYAGSDTKPWVNLRAAYGKEWWAYAARILDKKEYQEWYDRAEAYTKRRDWKSFITQVKKNKSVIIFGFSKISKKLYDALQKQNVSVACFVDNNTKVHGECYEGCEVLDVASAIEKYKGSAVIVASQNYKNAIKEQLAELGVPSECMIDYYNKSDIYYMSLDASYYEEEFRDVYYREFGIDVNDVEIEELTGGLSQTDKDCLREKYFMQYWIAG